jgi:hypothetical protein
MSGPDPRLNSLKHPVYAGGAATIVAALVAFIGLWVGNSGAVTNIFPGSPATTQTLAIPGPTVTAPGPTVTATVTTPAATPPAGSSGPVTTGVIHLADQSSRPEEILVGGMAYDQANVGINGKTFDFGWVGTQYQDSSPRIATGINLQRSYSRFSARLGVRDTSQASSVKLEVLADGVSLFSKVVTLQQSYDVNLPVSNVQRLEIKVYTPSPQGINFAIGDPTITP